MDFNPQSARPKPDYLEYVSLRYLTPYASRPDIQINTNRLEAGDAQSEYIFWELLYTMKSTLPHIRRDGVVIMQAVESSTSEKTYQT